MTNISKKGVFVALIIAISILLLTFGCVYAVRSQTAYADYDSDYLNNTMALVNFNQYCNQWYDGHTFDSGAYVAPISDNVSISGHYYYIFVRTDNLVNCDIRLSNDVRCLDLNNELDTIFLCELDNSNFRIYTRVNFSYTGLGIIDLTQMFGQNSEPDLEECQRIFTADYYAYNTGSSISFNSFSSYGNAYSQGYTDALGNQQIIYDGQLLINNVFPNIGDIYSSVSGTIINYQNGTWTNGVSLGFTLPSSSNGGDQVVITIDTIHIGRSIANDSQYSTLAPLYVGYYSNGTFVSLGVFDDNNMTYRSDYSLDGEYFKVYDNGSLTLTLPSGITALYFNCIGVSVQYYTLHIQLSSTSIGTAIQNSYNNGYNNAQQYYLDYYSNYYGENGVGYNNIYNSGYNTGINAQLSEAGRHFYTFPQFLGALFDVPVKTITSLLDFEVLGFNLKNFFFSLITLAIVFAIIRFILVRTGDK